MGKSSLPLIDGQVLPVDAQVALRSARLHVPDRKGERDALIAATSLVYGFAVVTRNYHDFKNTGAVVINPCDYVGRSVRPRVVK